MNFLLITLLFANPSLAADPNKAHHIATTKRPSPIQNVSSSKKSNWSWANVCMSGLSRKISDVIGL